MTITEIAVKRPLLIVVIFTVLILFGFLCYNKLNYNLLPKIELNVIGIVTNYPGASPREIENTVTKKIEDAAAAIEGVDQIISMSTPGTSFVRVQLENGISPDNARDDVQKKIDRIIAQLPQGADKPVINKFSLDEAPVLTMGVSANMNSKELFDLVNDQFKAQFFNVPGVGMITLTGGERRQIQINLDHHKLQAYKMSPAQVSAAIFNSNQSSPSGKIETNGSQQSIRYDAKIISLEQLRKVIILEKINGSKVYLTDVAEVLDGIEEATTLNHVNGLPSIGIQVLKQPGANAVKVSGGIREILTKIENQYKDKHLKFDIATDQSVFILASADSVMHDLMLAVCIVGLVMLFFLHSFRSSIFIMIALPCSMMPTFILMYLFGFSLNLMTLMALSLVVGILVDDSIVVLENIYRHFEKGTNKATAALNGRNEIGFTALAITLVDIVVFIPLAFSGGIIGNILREFSLVVVSSTLMSLFVSFTVTPLLASRFGKLQELTGSNFWGRVSLGFERFINGLNHLYGRILIWSLSHKKWLFGGTFALLAGSFLLLSNGFIGTSFISNADTGELVVQLELAPGSSLNKTNELVAITEKMLLSKKEVSKVFSNIGYSSMNPGSYPNKAELSVIMTTKENRQISAEDFGLLITDEIANIPGVKVFVTPVGITGNSGIANIDICVKGTDMMLIRQTAAMIREAVSKVPGTQGVKYGTDEPKPEINVKLDRDRMSALGLDANIVGMQLHNAFQGNNNSKFKQNGTEYDIMVGMDKMQKTSLTDIRDLTFINNNGQTFLLNDFAIVSQAWGETMLKRTDRLSSINVQASVAGRPGGTIGAEIKNILSGRNIPAGITIEYGGDMKNQDDAFGSLGLALVLAVVLVYLIMVALYENLLYPFVVLFAIPVATVGAFLALSLSMESLSIFAILGMIMLIGLVTKNAILIVDFTNQLREKGLTARDALLNAGKERLRPVLMTTTAMILGMLPIAVSSGAGAEVKNGMAWVIIGGLSSSLLLTLVIVPCVYLSAEIMVNKVRRLLQYFTSHKPVQKIYNTELKKVF